MMLHGNESLRPLVPDFFRRFTRDGFSCNNHFSTQLMHCQLTHSCLVFFFISMFFTKSGEKLVLCCRAKYCENSRPWRYGIRCAKTRRCKLSRVASPLCPINREFLSHLTCYPCHSNRFVNYRDFAFLLFVKIK